MGVEKFIRSSIIIACCFCSSAAYSQKSFLVDSGMAVFYPKGYDSIQHSPSFAIQKPLHASAPVPANWKLTPVFEYDGEKTVVRLSYDQSADLYGNGEVTGPLRRNGTKITLWNTDNFAFGKDNGKRLYQSHPWLMGVRADGSSFGILADNTYETEFDCANPLVISSKAPPFRILIIERESPQKLVQALAELTGKIELPPLWSLGYHQSRYSYFPDTQVLDIAGEFRKRSLPADVIWMDIDYMNKYKVFTFDKAAFPDPATLNKQLREMNFRSVYMIDPGIKLEKGYALYDAGTKRNYWVQDKNKTTFVGKVWPGDCVFPDFTMPAVRTWWSGLYKSFIAKGIDGVWNDMNEPAVFDGPGGTMPVDNFHRGGGALPSGTHARYHNVYGYLMVKASREGILKANPSKRPFVLSRANFLGGQQYAATWTGDNLSTWEHLKLATPMVLNLGLSGQPFSGPDLGGFSGTPSPELFAHWISVGVFYPFCRNHSAKSTGAQEPWSFGPAVEHQARVALNRRYRLLPYLYTQFYHASVNGMPVMQPLFFADITDTTLRKEEASFLFGPDILVEPAWVTNPVKPKGKWTRFQLEDELLDTSRVQPTLYLREGAMLPLTSRLIQSTREFRTDSLNVLVSPNAAGYASGEIYLDAGEGFDYQQGDYEVLSLRYQANKNGQAMLTCEQTAGNAGKRLRWFRIGVVGEGGVKYSEWMPGNHMILPTRE